jgi:hypothetical protein
MLRRRVLVVLVLTLVVAASAVLFACSQTPTSVPIRTFERAQKVDVICLRVYGDNAPEALKQEACAPVPPNVNGGDFNNQLFALVTQTTRGEVAVVNLSSGIIEDQRHVTPGINFLPVGSNPTDIATTPDGRMAFVASAEPNKFAIYGIPGHRILGDQAVRRDPDGPVTLPSWPVCALPQRPGSLTVVPRRAIPSLASDAGTDAGDDAGIDAGPDAGTDAGPTPQIQIDYELVAVLPGDRSNSAKVVTIDPRPFLRGSPRKKDDGSAAEGFGQGPMLEPGQLAPCPITAAIELSGEEALPASFRPGNRWPDGVPWVDGGVDLSCSAPAMAASCGGRSCACGPVTLPPPDAGPLPDAGAPVEDAGGCSADAGNDDNAERVLDLGPLDDPQPVAIARDDQTLYVADDGVPLIHVIDLSNPGAPRELPPFVVSSVVDPSRAVSIRDIAISPATHDLKRYLYAVDRKEGSIAIFDVTDPATAERTPMRRPHAELNPFQPPDRLAFAAPVVAVSFARHEVPIARVGGRLITNPTPGLLCNPNINVNPNPPDLSSNGAQYRADSQSVDLALGPRPTPGRLRGVFAFATLSNGEIVAIDVDDWDAPCRRPANLNGTFADATMPLGVLAVPQPNATGPGDFDPYHAPAVPAESVTQEDFFPVSAPHRMRSNYFLRDDPNTGKHIPYLASTPNITSKGSVAPPVVGQGSESTPLMRPTSLAPGLAVEKRDVGVLFSFDTPDVHFDQDWTVTYEGALPGFDGLPAALSTNDGYQTLTLSQPQAHFCAKGVEDWTVGQERARAVVSALAEARRVYEPDLDQRMVDYVQITDELLADGDPFWTEPDVPEPNGCWDDQFEPPSNSAADIARAGHRRFEFCFEHFATAGEESKTRDFPILEAYDDHLVVGTFNPDGSRQVMTGPANEAYLKVARCCFHHQFKYTVRPAAQWVTFGSVVGLLSHQTPGAGGRCEPSCDPNAVLLNSRAPSLPYTPTGVDFAPFRDSPLAMRNPAFSFFVQNGHVPNGSADKRPEREITYHFQSRGSFTPLSINLAATTAAVTPQSMRFIESLGQLAVVDGQSQGLVLIDLAGVGIARAPYF